ncbi:hypothetical protein D9M68_247840 [compost metagenome]
MSARLPWKVMLRSPTPSPELKDSPVTPFKVIRPLVAVSVTSTAPEPASTSLMLIRLPLPLLNTRVSSWSTVALAGTLLTGASLTAATARVRVVASASLLPVPDRPGSLPVLPPSSMATVSVTLAVALLAVVKLSPLAAMKALRSARLPVSVRVPVPEPPTLTPLALVAARVPLATLKVAVRLPAPASISVKLMPVRAVVTSSFTAMEPGAVMVGPSFTASMPTVAATLTPLLSTPPLLVPPLSLMLVSVTTRLLPVGASLLLR